MGSPETDYGSQASAKAANLHRARYYHTATLLFDRRVLAAAGNYPSGPLRSAGLYDPATGTWLPTGELLTARYGHGATLLPDSRVLVAGGYGFDFVKLASSELYDPLTGTWSAVGSLSNSRAVPTATVLPDGRGLVVGGFDDRGPLATAELYDSGP